MAKNKKPITKQKLTAKQEAFCQLYTSATEFYGNGVQSYIEAYNINLSQKGAYNNAKTSAYELLTKPYILDRLDELIEEGGLNDQYVDKRLLHLIRQDAEKGVAVRAIQEYNKLKSRITEKRENVHKFKNMSDEDIKDEIVAGLMDTLDD